MANRKVVSFSLLAICILATSFLSTATNEDRKVHIVYMGSLPEGEYSPTSHHLSILQSVVANSVASNSLILSYKRSFNGFAANLTRQESQKLASLEGVVSVFPSVTYHTQTTRSWDFMGLLESSSRKPSLESDIIIGVIDTGIWPESESFSPEGFGPPPKKWKGNCFGGVFFKCNNKIIGARVYGLRGIPSTRDSIGHGTHTASIAAGNAVKGASFYGIGEGTARGGAPSARIAAYKACNPFCEAHKIMAAMDDAISDGVDVITISLGHDVATAFDHDVVAIGAFHAMKRGVLVVHSAGNNGPAPGSIASVAPWLVTVAASSMDRRIADKVVLGNGAEMIGNSVNSFPLNETAHPLILARNATKECLDFRARSHISSSSPCLDPGSVKGKIVVCNTMIGADEAYRAGAIGSIFSGPNDVSFVSPPLPASALNKTDFASLGSYLNSSHHPEARIFKSEAFKDPTAPMIVSFSSRGPNTIAKEIMKPDISAPGINILAAFSPTISPSESTGDKRRVNYTMLSGTSMSCPHVAGAAAYVKSFHPDWSPSSIKSALMTTAGEMKKSPDSLEEFDYGSGLLDPVRAVNPGLVYDTKEEDYVMFLCSMGYKEESIRVIAGNKTSCPSQASEIGSPRDLNYPSMTAVFVPGVAFTVRFRRKVRNVGPENSTYKAVVVSRNPRVSIKVEPSAMWFESVGEEKSFDVIVKGEFLATDRIVSASLVWSDGTHRVRSPIVLHNL